MIARSPSLAGAQPARPVTGGPGSPDAYVPGVCNIGEYEIARRRRSGLVGIGVAVAIAAVTLAVAAPPVVRFVAVLLALTAGLSTYLQARRRFCVGFAAAGVENLGPDRGSVRRIGDAEARAADRRTALRLIRDALFLAAPVALLVALIPR